VIAQQERQVKTDWGKVDFKGGYLLIPPFYPPHTPFYQELSSAFKYGSDWLVPIYGAHGYRDKSMGTLASGVRLIGKKHGVVKDLVECTKREVIFAEKIGRHVIPRVNEKLRRYFDKPANLEVTVGAEKPIAALYQTGDNNVIATGMTLFEWANGTPGSNIFELHPEETLAGYPMCTMRGILRYIQDISSVEAEKIGIKWFDCYPTKQSMVEISHHNDSRSALHLTLIDFESCEPLDQYLKSKNR
jgi:hypothetical protein